jgi:hypothetical protein
MQFPQVLFSRRFLAAFADLITHSFLISFESIANTGILVPFLTCLTDLYFCIRATDKHHAVVTSSIKEQILSDV